MTRHPLRLAAFALAALATCGTPPPSALAGVRITEEPPPPAASPRDSVVERVGPRASGFGPGEALGIGLAATALPILVASSSGRHGSDRTGAMALAATAGVVVGPAVGLAWGGRGDLAARGVVIRVAGLGASALGVLGIAASMSGENSSDAGYGALAVLAVGGAIAGLSAAYDLAITPSAVAEGRPRAALGVRPDGKVAVHVSF